MTLLTFVTFSYSAATECKCSMVKIILLFRHGKIRFTDLAPLR